MASAPSPRVRTRPVAMIVGVAVAAALGLGCGPSSGTGPPSTLAPLPEAAGSTTAPPISLAPISVEPAPLSDLVLGATGIGAATLGDGAEGVIAYIGGLLGAATADSGWVDVAAAGLACPGAWHRAVAWGVLRLEFLAGDPPDPDETGETGETDTGPQEPADGFWRGWEYGLDGRLGEEPQDLITAEGLSLGARVDELRAAHPGVVLRPGEEGVYPPSFEVPGALTGYLTGISESDVITVLQAGVRCG